MIRRFCPIPGMAMVLAVTTTGVLWAESGRFADVEREAAPLRALRGFRPPSSAIARRPVVDCQGPFGRRKNQGLVHAGGFSAFRRGPSWSREISTKRGADTTDWPGTPARSPWPRRRQWILRYYLRFGSCEVLLRCLAERHTPWVARGCIVTV